MSRNEFRQWVAYHRTSPIGPVRGDFHAAIVAETVANSLRGKGSRGYTRKDFMPFWKERRQTDEEIGNSILAWARATKAKLALRRSKREKKV